MKRVLMVAFHFPPASISSGIQRTLKFATYLPELGWKPSVLTVHPRAYESTGGDQMGDIPPDLVVRRAFALNSARHMTVAGRYPLFLALPDRWSSWWIGGVVAGLKMIRKERPDVLWSTYPIATAHLIALTLHRLTGIPWVADCRDSMTEEHYPPNGTVRSVYRWLERQAAERAARVAFTSPGTLAMYAKRYPHVPASRWGIIENGYDEGNFSAAERGSAGAGQDAGRVTLIHSGILYPSERDPTQFFDAIAELKKEGVISGERLCIRLRGTRYESVFAPELERRGIADIVSLDPPTGYEPALREMLSADGLLIFQAANCNHQIPAKLYEYFRARRPVLGLTDPVGDTASEMRHAGLDAIAPLDDKAEIKRQLAAFLAAIEQKRAAVARDSAIASASRRSRTAQLAELLSTVA